MISNDKLFVVIMVMAIVFAGLGTYLFLIDRKLSRIEKKHKEDSVCQRKIKINSGIQLPELVNCYFCI